MSEYEEQDSAKSCGWPGTSAEALKGHGGSPWGRVVAAAGRGSRRDLGCATGAGAVEQRPYGRGPG